jgi:FkbM family methyltransferase
MEVEEVDYSEKLFFETIFDKCDLIFDVGVGNFSIFLEYEKLEVHYFEPYEKCITDRPKENIKNKKYYMNNVGLSNKKEILPYFAEGALYDRHITNTHLADCQCITGLDYCNENNITNIDFLKIDVEGMETKVLQGFGDILKNVKYIQFEYGLGLAEVGSKLSEIWDLLSQYGFTKFYKQTGQGLVELNDSTDFWEFCNIVTFNNNLVTTI